MKIQLTSNKLNSIFLFICFFILSTISIHSQDKAQKIETLLKTNYEQGRFNGSALVSHNGNIVYKDGFGMANMEWDIPNEPDTKHRLGSITKQFTGMLILQLAEKGKIDLKAPISQYLPDYPKNVANKVTTHHLLTHTSGIPNYTSLPGFFNDQSRDPYSPEEFIEVFSELPLDFEPGEKYSYSNSGYFLLGVMIEKLSGMTYEEALQRNILEPLGMNDSGFDMAAPILKKRATGYQKNGRNYQNAPYLDMSIPYSAGSMYSTVEDLYKWDQALYENKILSMKYMDLFFKPHFPSGEMHYAYGWNVGKVPLGSSQDSIYAIAHGGGINGFNTIIVRTPKSKSSVILLNNTGGTSLRTMASAILAILHEKAYDLPKKSLAYKLLDDFNATGVAALKNSYANLKDNPEYEVNENDMNGVGYQLLQADEMEAAETIFKINMMAFPNSFNVYDSYAESLMLQGKNDQAIEFYKKSLELNPGNENGVEMLKKLGVDMMEVANEVEIADEVLESYTGKYELMPGFVIEVTKGDEGLVAQATGQPSFRIYPSSESRFYLKEVNAQIEFNTNENGSIESLTLFQAGREMVGKKLEE